MFDFACDFSFICFRYLITTRLKAKMIQKVLGSHIQLFKRRKLYFLPAPAELEHACTHGSSPAHFSAMQPQFVFRDPSGFLHSVVRQLLQTVLPATAAVMHPGMQVVSAPPVGSPPATPVGSTGSPPVGFTGRPTCPLTRVWKGIIAD